MVSYYNPATAAAMFGRSSSGYPHHHHHSPPTQNHPYFTPAYGAGYHHHNPHSHHAQAAAAAAAAGGSGGTGSPVGTGLGASGLPGGVTSTQFSPSMTADFNCNHQYNAHFGNMTPDSVAAAAAAAAAASNPWSTGYSTACLARNAAAVAAGLPPPPPPSATHGSSYEDWSSVVGSGHPHHPHHMHPHAYSQHHPHPSFYNHHANVQQPSPPSSTPSSPSSSHSPSHNVYSTSSTTPNNNANSTNNNSTPFKAEFGPCSGGNNQDASSQEMQQTNQGNSTSVAAVTSAGPSIGTPHSPDSGMAISDGVSSSGSPATNGQQFHPTQHCLGGPSSNSSGSSSTNHSSSANPGGNNGSSGNNGSDNSQQQQFATAGGNMVHGMSSHHSHHGHLHGMNSSNNQSSGNLNHHHHSHHQSIVKSEYNHQNGIVNVTSTGRPTQARSPYEWMKKPTYSCSSSGSNPSSNNSKTRTKDKYRVVYSDNQRLELEKEFHYSRYITIRRKAELASILGLSERQVKIWFQNRRAKERKVQRKREEMHQREKLSTMVHMQNASIAAAGMMGGPMCNQPNPGGVPLSALM